MSALILIAACQLCSLAAMQYRRGLAPTLGLAASGWLLGSAVLALRGSNSEEFWLFESILTANAVLMAGPVRQLLRRLDPPFLR